MPARYGHGSSSISSSAAARYAVQTMATFGAWYLHRWGIRRIPRFGHRPLPPPFTPRAATARRR
jgi:hypothetical protein